VEGGCPCSELATGVESDASEEISTDELSIPTAEEIAEDAGVGVGEGCADGVDDDNGHAAS